MPRPKVEIELSARGVSAVQGAVRRVVGFVRNAAAAIGTFFGARAMGRQLGQATERLNQLANTASRLAQA